MPRGQVASARLATRLTPADAAPRALNALLPADVRVLAVDDVPRTASTPASTRTQQALPLPDLERPRRQPVRAALRLAHPAAARRRGDARRRRRCSRPARLRRVSGSRGAMSRTTVRTVYASELRARRRPGVGRRRRRLRATRCRGRLPPPHGPRPSSAPWSRSAADSWPPARIAADSGRGATAPQPGRRRRPQGLFLGGRVRATTDEARPESPGHPEPGGPTVSDRMCSIARLVPPGGPDVALARQIDFDRLPRHVAIIMDGNGRWAAQRHLPRVEGHRAGIESVRDAVETSARLGIEVLTLYAFSVENWKRPRVRGQRADGAAQALPALRAATRCWSNDIRFQRHRPRATSCRPTSSAELRDAERAHRGATRGMQFNIALNYGGRAEIVDAARRALAAGRHARRARRGALRRACSTPPASPIPIC